MIEGTVARAFELARDGSCKSIAAIRAQLKRERYSQIDEHMNGSSIKKQLSAAMKVSQRAF